MKNKIFLANVVVFLAIVMLIFRINNISQENKIKMKQEEEMKIKQEEEMKIKQEEEQKRVSKEKQKEEEREYYEKNKKEIYNNLKTFISEKNTDAAYALINAYKNMNDENLTNLIPKVDNIKTKQILMRLKHIDEKEFYENKALYRILVKLNPDNKEYKQKLDYYDKKFGEQVAAREAKLVLRGKKPVASAWDGSYLEVEQYLKAVANDPDSIKIDDCTKVYETDDGWVVGCDYRGKNAFGGMVRKFNWFVIVQNKVIEVKEFDEYKVK